MKKYNLILFIVYIFSALQACKESNFKYINVLNYEDIHSIPITDFDVLDLDENLYSTNIQYFNALGSSLLSSDRNSSVYQYFSLTKINNSFEIKKNIHFADSNSYFDSAKKYYFNAYYIFQFKRNVSNEYCYMKLLVKDTYFNSNKPIKGLYLIWANTTDINEHTQYLKTNLPEEMIRKLFPNFKGKYIYEYYKQILIDYKYSIDSDEFYKHIEFIK